MKHKKDRKRLHNKKQHTCDYIITNLMHWLLFIHKIFSSTCFEHQVLIFRSIQLYTCSICYCHSLQEFVGACRYTAWVRTQAVYRQATTNSRREWHCHMLQVYNCILLKMSTWCSKHVEENNILWINNNHHKHQGLDSLIRSVSRVTAALTNVF